MGASQQIRERYGVIVERWKCRVSEQRPGSGRSAPALDGIGQALLEALASWLERDGAGPFEPGLAEHEQCWLDRGVSLPDIFDEYALLRRCVIHTLRDAGVPVEAPELDRIHGAFDRALGQIVEHFIEMHGAKSAYRRAELQTILEGVPDAIYVGGPGGIELANARALDMLGFDSLQELNRGIPELSTRLQNRHLDTGERLRPEEEGFSRALAGETSVTRVICRHLRTGKDVVVRCAAAPIVVDGSIRAAVAINTDITDEVVAQRERELLLGILGHDLKGPLQAIAMGLELQRGEAEDDSPHARAFTAMKKNLQRMSRLITQLMDFARSRSGKMTRPGPSRAAFGHAGAPADSPRSKSRTVEAWDGRDARPCGQPSPVSRSEG